MVDFPVEVIKESFTQIHRAEADPIEDLRNLFITAVRFFGPASALIETIRKQEELYYYISTQNAYVQFLNVVIQAKLSGQVAFYCYPISLIVKSGRKCGSSRTFM